MVRLVRPGGLVFILVHPNEAITSQYQGFHRYNFANVKGRLVLHSKYLANDIDVLDELGGLVADIKCNEGSSTEHKFGAVTSGSHRHSIAGRISCDIIRRHQPKAAPRDFMRTRHKARQRPWPGKD